MSGWSAYSNVGNIASINTNTASSTGSTSNNSNANNSNSNTSTYDDSSDDPIAETFEEDIPIPAKELDKNYSLERVYRGEMMADFLKRLAPLIGADTRQHLLQLRDLFSKQNLLPGNPYGTIERDPRLIGLIGWFDQKFDGLPAWPQGKGIGNQKQAKFEILYGIARGVKYLSTQNQRNKYKITIEAGRLSRNGIVFDTGKIYTTIKEKRTYNMTDDVGKGVIWVLGKDMEFYSAVAKLSRIHHSSFFGGNAILSGGDWEVEEGKIKRITGRTGHYRASMESFIAMLKILWRENAIQGTDPVARVYHRTQREWTDMSYYNLEHHQAKYQLYDFS